MRYLLTCLCLALMPIQASADVKVYVHPQAAVQPTRGGRTLSHLFAFEGRIYAGYGDYGRNTGPIAINPFVPDSGFAGVEHVSQTEAILQFRRVGTSLVAPAVDPVGYGTVGTDYAVKDAHGWRDVDEIGVIHAYDAGGDRDLETLVGAAAERGPAVWRRVDGEWRIEAPHQFPQSNLYLPHGGEFRYHFIASFGGQTYVQLHGDRWSRIWNGMRWLPGPNLLPNGGTGWRATVWRESLFYLENGVGNGERNGSVDVDTPSRLLRFDGLTPEIVRENVYDVTCDGARCHALDSAGTVWVTQDGQTWSVRAQFPTSARSIAVLDERLYAGGLEATLFAEA
ncbi:MAG TPA: hypothetical protein VM600_06730 [Actinomycetota bacterium]|nr:hypothetical protein [Actinomycetota bacterium]